MGLFDKLFGKKEEVVNPNHIFAPMAGQTVPVAEVPDPTFARVCWVKALPLSLLTARYMLPAMLP